MGAKTAEANGIYKTDCMRQPQSLGDVAELSRCLWGLRRGKFSAARGELGKAFVPWFGKRNECGDGIGATD